MPSREMTTRELAEDIIARIPKLENYSHCTSTIRLSDMNDISLYSNDSFFTVGLRIYSLGELNESNLLSPLLNCMLKDVHSLVVRQQREEERVITVNGKRYQLIEE